MKEVVVISGKGGTGKTSLVASFAHLAGRSVLADCDVDAADLHLVLAPRIIRREEFVSGFKALIDAGACIGCGKCREVCRFDAVKETNGEFTIYDIACEGCGFCHEICPVDAVKMLDNRAGEWFLSETEYGPMVHARLGIAQENSGKLVTLVRNQAKRVAEEEEIPLIIVDGPPGIGCPVIASLTGAKFALIVTEPTLSGMHDLDRILRLTRHFGITSLVCVNKCDLNPEITGEIERKCKKEGVAIAGKIPYDIAFTKAQIMKSSIIEYSGKAASAVRDVWKNLTLHLEQPDTGDE